MHFHAGIDISTGDITGYKVFAMRDGFVKRIRVYPNGYGKIVYVQHVDGYTTAYAHLSRFAANLEKRVEDEQARLGQYPVALEFGENEFPVKKGEVIAYTGDTGIGSPHLHVEIRDPHQEPINPQLCPNLRAPDNIRPTMFKVAVIPVEGHPEELSDRGARIYTLRHVGPGKYRLRQPLIVAGRAGIAIDTRDQTDDTRFQRSVYRIQLFVDSVLWMDCIHDRAPLEYAQLIGAAYAWPLVDRRIGRFEKLYEEIPGALPFYHSSQPGHGLVGPGLLSHGPHRLKIITADIAGNQAELEGTMIVSEGRGDGSPFSSTNTPDGFPILPGASGSYTFDEGRLTVQYDSGSVFSPLYLTVRRTDTDDGPAYAFTPSSFILRDGLRVSLKTDSTNAHADLFFRNRAALRFLSKRSPDDHGVLQGRIIQTLGTLSVRSDVIPPDVSRLSVRVINHGLVAIGFRIRDNLSGVEYESVKLYIDSTPVIPYIDGEHRRVQYQSSVPLERGSHRIVIRCSDRAGNSRTVEYHFTVR